MKRTKKYINDNPNIFFVLTDKKIQSFRVPFQTRILKLSSRHEHQVFSLAHRRRSERDRRESEVREIKRNSKACVFFFTSKEVS